METIEERAKAYADEMVLGIKNYKSKSAKVQKVHWESYYNQYVTIAIDQNDIDIKKAIEWLNNNARHLLSAELRRQFRYAMEV